MILSLHLLQTAPQIFVDTVEDAMKRAVPYRQTITRSNECGHEHRIPSVHRPDQHTAVNRPVIRRITQQSGQYGSDAADLCTGFVCGVY